MKRFGVQLPYCALGTIGERFFIEGPYGEQ